MALKQFNEIIAAEIARAHAFETQDDWHRAKQIWLDIIEYCELFARKTPELKPATCKMILSKAEKLLNRVTRIDEKIKAEHLVPVPDHAGHPLNELQVPAGIEDEEPDLEPAAEPPAPGESVDREEYVTGDEVQGDQSRSIDVGDEHIAIPDDFPLIEITPKNSFKPPSQPPDTQTIDATRHPVDEPGTSKDEKQDTETPPGKRPGLR